MWKIPIKNSDICNDMLEQSQKYKDGFLELTNKQTDILLNNTQV